MPRHRLGVALLLPEPLATEVNGLRRACGDTMLHAVPPHITLVPPVNVRVDDIEGALALVRSAAAAGSPLRLTIGPGQTFFPEAPVVFLAVGGDVGPLVALRDRVFRPPLARSLTWPFVPHVTVADEIDEADIPAAVRVLAHFDTVAVIDRVHVLREHHHDTAGRVWEPLGDATFGPPAVVGRGGLPVELAVTERLDPEASAFTERAWAQYGVDEYGLRDDELESLAVTARRDGAVVGTACGEVRRDEAYLARLVVDRSCRDEGVGTHLLAAFEHAAASRGCRSVTLRTQASGRAEQFYRERGYQEHSRLPDWRHGRDFVRLVRYLPDR